MSKFNCNFFFLFFFREKEREIDWVGGAEREWEARSTPSVDLRSGPEPNSSQMLNRLSHSDTLISNYYLIAIGLGIS